jgi:hypothetical protein
MALVIAGVFYLFMKRTDENPKLLSSLLLVMLLVNILYWCYVTFHTFPADIDQHNLHSGTKTAYTLLGCLIGLLVARTLDEKYIHFEVKAVWWAQILKVALGLGVVMAVRVGAKPVLALIMGEHAAAGAVRYFLMCVVGGGLWPMTFKYFGKLGK